MTPHRATWAAARTAALRFSRLLLCLAFIGLAGGGVARAEILLTDAAGRNVRLEKPAVRIVTNESLLLLSLALIDPGPVSRIAGWAAPQRIDSGIYDAFRKRWPGIDDIPVVGAVVPDKALPETILGASPDLFVVSTWHPGWESITKHLEAAGVPVIFLDGPENAARNPGDATAFSMTVLGKAIGREAQAGAFAEFIRSHYSLVIGRLKNVASQPDVLIDAHAGDVCCSSPGADNRMTEYLELAGGRNIGAGIVPGYDGKLSPEYVLGLDPDVYIATGGPHLTAQGGFVIGGGSDADSARASLRSVAGRDIRGALTAINEGRAYGVSHQLSISALNVLVFECFAKWTHPGLFTDLDPADTLAEINRRFMAVPLEGVFWISLNGDSGTDRQR